MAFSVDLLVTRASCCSYTVEPATCMLCSHVTGSCGQGIEYFQNFLCEGLGLHGVGRVVVGFTF